MLNCIVNSYDYGKTVVYNTCLGTTTVVPWGTETWVQHVGSWVLTAALLYGAYMLAKNVKDHINVEVKTLRPQKKTVPASVAS